MDWQPPTKQALLAAETAEQPVDGRARVRAIAGLVADGDLLENVTQAWLDRAVGLLEDAAAARDEGALVALQASLRRLYSRLQVDLEGPVDADCRAALSERRGWVTALVTCVAAVMERLAPQFLANAIEPGSHADRFLYQLAVDPGLSSRELAERIPEGGPPLDEAQLSRLGRRLLGQGLADVVRTGRRNSWELTPRGEQLRRDLAAKRGRGLPVAKPEAIFYASSGCR